MTPTTTPHSNSLKSPFFLIIVMLSLNFSTVMFAWMHALSYCHVIGWLDNCVNEQLNSAICPCQSKAVWFLVRCWRMSSENFLSIILKHFPKNPGQNLCQFSIVVSCFIIHFCFQHMEISALAHLLQMPPQLMPSLMRHATLESLWDSHYHCGAFSTYLWMQKKRYVGIIKEDGGNILKLEAYEWGLEENSPFASRGSPSVSIILCSLSFILVMHFFRADILLFCKVRYSCFNPSQSFLDVEKEGITRPTEWVQFASYKTFYNCINSLEQGMQVRTLKAPGVESLLPQFSVSLCASFFSSFLL